MDEVELLQFLRARDVRGQERIEERFVVWTPPLGEAVADVPFRVGGRRVRGCEPVVQPVFEALDLIGRRGEIVAWSVWFCQSGLCFYVVGCG